MTEKSTTNSPRSKYGAFQDPLGKPSHRRFLSTVVLIIMIAITSKEWWIHDMVRIEVFYVWAAYGIMSMLGITMEGLFLAARIATRGSHWGGWWGNAMSGVTNIFRRQRDEFPPPMPPVDDDSQL